MANSKECEYRRTHALVFPKDCEMDLPSRFKTWSECYNAYLEALPEDSIETLFFEYYEAGNQFLKKRIFVPYMVMMVCNEAFEEILKDEKYEGMALTKRTLKYAIIKTKGIHASILN